jgi:subtilisin family serine protease
MEEEMPTLNNLSLTGVVDELPQPVIHDLSHFGLAPVVATGNGVKICIADSGVPDHDAVLNIGGHADFTEDESFVDSIGHCTILSGLVGGHKPDHFQGIAPDALLYFAKTTNDEGVAQLDATIASVLWAIGQEADVVLLPLVLDEHNVALQETIDKANQNNVCVVMAASTDVPVRYENSLQIYPIGKRGIAYSSGASKISIYGKDLYTTFLEQSYARVGGGACSAAVAAGVCALLVERNRRDNVKFNPAMIFSQLIQLTLNKEIL